MIVMPFVNEIVASPAVIVPTAGTSIETPLGFPGGTGTVSSDVTGTMFKTPGSTTAC